MTVRIRVGVTVALAAVAVAGCSPTTDPGQPEPKPTTSTSGAAGSQVSRPKDLKIANVDPCSLLTDAQMAQMSITHKAPGPGHAEAGSTTSCSYTVLKPAVYSLNVSLEPKRGVEDWLAGKYVQEVRSTSVQSYPAIQTLLAGEKFSDPNATFCATNVSTAAGQELNATVLQTDKDLSTTQLCDLSKQAAGLVLTTLQANQ